MVATQTCSQTTSYRYDLKRLTIHNCTNCTQLYKFEKKMVPQDIEEKEELSIETVRGPSQDTKEEKTGCRRHST
jgi:dTDP-D-glucose 4,6-dehydratase